LNKYAALQAYNLNLSPFCRIIAAYQETTSLDAFLETFKTLPDDFFQSSGWRFLAAEGDLYGGAHVGSIIPGQPPKLTGFSDSVQVLAAVESFNELSNVTPASGNFEIRVLRITWLHFEAFWLYWVPPGGSQPPPGGGTAGSQPRGTDIIVPYIGFVESATGRQISAMDTPFLPEFLKKIIPRTRTVCAQSLAHQAGVFRLQAQQFKAQADAQASSASALESQAKALDAQAKDATNAAAHAQVRANINKATAQQIQIALPLTSEEAQRIADSIKKQRIRSWEDLGKVVDLKKLEGKQVGWGRSS
jgi:hypothetical protein